MGASLPPSSASSTLVDGRAMEGYNQDKTPYDGSVIVDWLSLELYPPQNKGTEANISPEHGGQAETDLENSGPVENPTTSVAGGVNSADFPDGGYRCLAGCIRGMVWSFLQFWMDQLHWRLPDILSTTPTQQLRPRYDFIDYVYGDVHDVHQRSDLWKVL
jgi:hypothetical protein